MTKIDLKWFLEKMVFLSCILAPVMISVLLAIFIGYFFYTISIVYIAILILLAILFVAGFVQ